jgi:hypothetical protein
MKCKSWEGYPQGELSVATIVEQIQHLLCFGSSLLLFFVIALKADKKIKLTPQGILTCTRLKRFKFKIYLNLGVIILEYHLYG